MKAQLEQATEATTIVEAARDKSIPFYNELVQLDHEIALMKQIPEMSEQLFLLERQRPSALKCLAAANAGFDPFIPPSTGNWYWGFLSKLDKSYSGYRVLRRAMPQSAITSYNKAKELNVFDIFTVHSPQADIFEDIAPKTPPVDPFLVGWVNAKLSKNNLGNVSGSFDPNDGTSNRPTSFLIAQWDLASDLRAGGLLELPSGK